MVFGSFYRMQFIKRLGKMYMATVDIRDHRWYNPEESKLAYHDIFSSIVYQKSITIKNDDSINKESTLDIWKGVSCNSHPQHTLFPPPPQKMKSSFSKLMDVYMKYPKMNWNIRSGSLCVYPTEWEPLVYIIIGKSK